MFKRFLALILSAQVAALSPTYGATVVINSYRFAAGGGGSLLVNENFEGTGTPAGWTVLSGSPDFDNTSSPLAGSQDLKAAASVGIDCKVDFTASNEIWVEFLYSRFNHGVTDNSFAYLEAGAQYIGIAFISGAGLQLVQGGTLIGSATTDAIPDDTKMWIWLHAIKGTGANATYELEWNTTSTRSGSGTKFVNYTSGTVTNQWVDFEHNHGAGVGDSSHLDNLRISNTGWPP